MKHETQGSWSSLAKRLAQPSERRILALFAAVGIVLFLFAKLAGEVREGETLGFDRWVMLALRHANDPARPLGPDWLVKALTDLTALGGVSVLTLVTAIAAGYLIAARKHATALFLIGAIAGGAIVSTLLKDVFQRARPDIVAHLVTVNSTSFPSGHAMNSAVAYLTLGAALARAQQGRRVRIFIMVVAIALTLVIGFSRVYLGVHWPSDVIAGWTVGAAWAMLCSLVEQYLQAKGHIESRQDQDKDAAEAPH